MTSSLVRQLISFGMGSILTNLGAYLLAISMRSLGYSYEVSSGFGFVIGAIISYIVQSKVTFRSSASGLKIKLKFTFTYITGLFLTIGMAGIAAGLPVVTYEVAQIAIILITGLFLFIVQKVWIFKE